METNNEKLERLLKLVPEVVREDVKKRVSDWVGSGGSMEHPYIEQQIRFLNNWLEKLNVEPDDSQSIYGFRGENVRKDI